MSTETTTATGVVIPPVKLLKADAIQPAPYNPRRITPTMFESLKAGIRAYGMVEPLVVQKHSEAFGDNVLVGGHQRLKAMREIAVEDSSDIPKVPCTVLDIDDRQAKMLNVSLNKISGEFDTRLLSELIDSVNATLPVTSADALLLGFDGASVAELLQQTAAGPDLLPELGEDEGALTRTISLNIEFTDHNVHNAVKAKLAELAAAGGKCTGDIVYDLLGLGQQ